MSPVIQPLTPGMNHPVGSRWADDPLWTTSVPVRPDGRGWTEPVPATSLPVASPAGTTFACPNCGASNWAGPEQLNQWVACFRCDEPVVTPDVVRGRGALSFAQAKIAGSGAPPWPFDLPPSHIPRREDAGGTTGIVMRPNQTESDFDWMSACEEVEHHEDKQQFPMVHTQLPAPVPTSSVLEALFPNEGEVKKAVLPERRKGSPKTTTVTQPMVPFPTNLLEANVVQNPLEATPLLKKIAILVATLVMIGGVIGAFVLNRPQPSRIVASVDSSPVESNEQFAAAVTPMSVSLNRDEAPPTKVEPTDTQLTLFTAAREALVNIASATDNTGRHPWLVTAAIGTSDTNVLPAGPWTVRDIRLVEELAENAAKRTAFDVVLANAIHPIRFIFQHTPQGPRIREDQLAAQFDNRLDEFLSNPTSEPKNFHVGLSLAHVFDNTAPDPERFISLKVQNLSGHGKSERAFIDKGTSEGAQLERDIRWGRIYAAHVVLVQEAAIPERGVNHPYIGIRRVYSCE